MIVEDIQLLCPLLWYDNNFITSTLDVNCFGNEVTDKKNIGKDHRWYK